MTRATHICFTTVLELETRCRDALLRGEACDSTLNEQIDDATRVARIAVSDACSEGALTDVGYFGFADASADLSNACVTQAQGAVAATYAPALPAMASETAAECMTATAAYGAKVMRYALERQTPVFERLASRLFEEDEKSEQVLQMRIELRETRQRWIAGLTQACPQFADIYGRSAESYLRTLGQRTDCVLSKTYVNDAVSCITQQCGNGIREDPEKCDDGNADDGDGCRNDCTTP